MSDSFEVRGLKPTSTIAPSLRDGDRERPVRAYPGVASPHTMVDVDFSPRIVAARACYASGRHRVNDSRASCRGAGTMLRAAPGAVHDGPPPADWTRPGRRMEQRRPFGDLLRAHR